MKAAAPGDGPETLAGILDVSRETIERLRRHVDLVRKWQTGENLVAPSTLPSLWRRHVVDSAQIAALFPRVESLLDLGSGAGFPGLVVAIVSGARADLVESNGRKCAFLREAIRVTGANAKVHEGRIEAIVAKWDHATELVTARALAPLAKLLELCHPLIRAGARAGFHKGREFQREVDEASQSWDFDLAIHRSRVDSEGVILEVSRLAPKVAA
jgi:16S rRNA (guanine527-N7)-methyltransferase